MDTDDIENLAFGLGTLAFIGFAIWGLFALTHDAINNSDPNYTWVGNELVWTDPAHGCRYLIGDDGGRSAMVLPSGLPDCGGAK